MSEERTLTIDERTARYLYTLFENCEAADAILLPCQNTIFRSQIHGCYKAPNVEEAFEKLKNFLEGKEVKP